MEHSIILMLYASIISFLCIRFFWIANYFIMRKKETQTISSQGKAHSRMPGFDMKTALLWFIIGANTISQISRVFLSIPLFISNLDGMENLS